MGNSVDLFGLQRCARPGLEALADLAAYGTGTRTPCELVVNWSCHEQLAVSHDAASSSRAFEGLGNKTTRGEVTGQYIMYTPKVHHVVVVTSPGLSPTYVRRMELAQWQAPGAAARPTAAFASPLERVCHDSTYQYSNPLASCRLPLPSPVMSSAVLTLEDT